MGLKDRLSITEVAKSVGVTPRTIMRWEKTGKIKRPGRDWRGWRFYLKDDVEGIKKFYESTYEYEEGDRSMANAAKVVVSAIILMAASYTLPLFDGTASCAELASAIPQKSVTETKTSVDINLNKISAVQQPPKLTVSEAIKYTLGPDDVIEIDVRRHPEFSGQYTVTTEGKIEYKFVGDVIVNGLTKVELQARLSEILSEYIIDPEINVQIVAYLSKVYYVVGEVNKPGKFYMRGNSIEVREALIQSDLPSQSAAMRKCRLISPGAKGRDRRRYVNVYELLYGGDLKQNVEMKPGDILYVPSTIVGKIIKVVSPVTNAVSSAAGAAAAGAVVGL